VKPPGMILRPRRPWLTKAKAPTPRRRPLGRSPATTEVHANDNKSSRRGILSKLVSTKRTCRRDEPADHRLGRAEEWLSWIEPDGRLVVALGGGESPFSLSGHPLHTFLNSWDALPSRERAWVAVSLRRGARRRRLQSRSSCRTNEIGKHPGDHLPSFRGLQSG